MRFLMPQVFAYTRSLPQPTVKSQLPSKCLSNPAKTYRYLTPPLCTASTAFLHPSAESGKVWIHDLTPFFAAKVSISFISSWFPMCDALIEQPLAAKSKGLSGGKGVLGKPTLYDCVSFYAEVQVTEERT
jgi:hypothetical protein